MSVRDDRPKILIADDDPEIVSLLIDVLEQDGYRLFVAQDAEGAVNMALAHQPDLMLLDVIMPEGGGYQIYQELQARAPDREHNVIFLTGVDQPERMQQAFALGAVDYMTKPFSIALLRARIRTWLVRLGRLGSESATAPAPPDAQTS
ncbi:MAG TPA: response regulator [Chloroflexota bacterium]|jgi:putative two-component system response regulator